MMTVTSSHTDADDTEKNENKGRKTNKKSKESRKNKKSKRDIESKKVNNGIETKRQDDEDIAGYEHQSTAVDTERKKIRVGFASRYFDSSHEVPRHATAVAAVAAAMPLGLSQCHRLRSLKLQPLLPS